MNASIVRADTASYRLQFFANNHFHASVYNNDFMYMVGLIAFCTDSLVSVAFSLFNGLSP